jgi:hypothetical protein
MRSRRIACTLAALAAVVVMAGSGCASETRVGATDQGDESEAVTGLAEPASTTTVSPNARIPHNVLLYEAAATIEIGYTLASAFTVDVDALTALNPAVTFRQGRPGADAEPGEVWVTGIASSVICFSSRDGLGAFTTVKHAVAGPLPGRTFSTGPEPPAPCDEDPLARLWDEPADPSINLCPARHLLTRLGAFDGTNALASLVVFGEPGQVQADDLALVDTVLVNSAANVPIEMRDDWEYLHGLVEQSRTAVLAGTFVADRVRIFDDRSTRLIADLATFVEQLPCLPDDHLRPFPEAATAE